MKLFSSRRSYRLIALSLACLLLTMVTAQLSSPSVRPERAFAAAPTPTITPVSDPAVVITSTTNNAVLSTSQAPILITAIAFTGNSSLILQVSFRVDGVVIGSATSAPYQAYWTNVSAGSHSLQAVASFSNGGSLFSPLVTVTVRDDGSPTPTPTPTVTPTGTPVASGCRVNYQRTNQWPGGFSANLTITNLGTTTINDWTLTFVFPGDQKITQLWNGSFSQSGAQVTITPASWNHIIAPGGAVNTGFNGSWTSNNTNPTSFSLNGMLCTQ